MRNLKQILQSPIHVTCSTSASTDHILTKFLLRASQRCVINVDVPDHQLVIFTRKISKIKTGNVHKYLNFCSLKNYTAD